MPAESRYTASDVKIGLLVVASAVFLVLLVAVTSDIGRYFRPKRTLSVLFTHVVGLQANSPVRYSGVEVGRVKRVSVVTLDHQILARIPPISPALLYDLPISDREALESLRRVINAADFDRQARAAMRGRDMVQLELEVDADALSIVHQDDYVSVESTLMGDTSVEISPGCLPELPAAGFLIGRSGSMFTRIGDAVDEIRYLMRTAGAALASKEADIPTLFAKLHKGAENLVEAAANFRKTGATLAGIVEDTREDVVQLAANANSVAKRTDQLLEGAQASVQPLVENSAAAAAELRRSLESVRPRTIAVVDAIKALAERLTTLSGQASSLASETLAALEEGRADVRRSTLNLRDATKNVEEFTALIKQKPWLLLRAPRGVDRELEDALSHARLMREAATRLQEAAQKIALMRTPPDAEAARIFREAAQELAGIADAARRDAREITETLKPLPLKEGGRGFEASRRPAD